MAIEKNNYKDKYRKYFWGSNLPKKSQYFFYLQFTRILIFHRRIIYNNEHFIFYEFFHGFSNTELDQTLSDKYYIHAFFQLGEYFHVV